MIIDKKSGWEFIIAFPTLPPEKELSIRSDLSLKF